MTKDDKFVTPEEEQPQRIGRAEYLKRLQRQTRRAGRNMRLSVLALFLVIVLVAGYLVYLLYGMSVKDHRYYSELAANTHTKREVIYPVRGDIYDANNNPLALSTYSYTIGITPSVFGPRRGSEYKKAEVEEKFCQILDLNLKKFRKQLVEYKDEAYIVLAKQISSEKNDELSLFLKEALVSGVRQDAEPTRYYPQGSLAADLIGFANKREANLAGVTGVEAFYDEELAGEPGFRYRQVDNYWAQALPDTSEIDQPAVEALDLQLHLQSDLQLLVQEYTKTMAAVSEAQNGAQIIVLDAKTAAILALSDEQMIDLNKPSAPPAHIDPADWNPSTNEEQRDYMTGQLWSGRAIRYPFEIGSISKPFVAAMALDEGHITPEGLVNDDYVFISGWPYPISSYDRRSRGLLSLTEAVWDSRNPPFIRLAEAVGIETFYSYLNDLGLHNTSGADLPNETVGLIHQEPKFIDMAMTSIGEQVTFTLMQVAKAYVALANGGYLMEPRVARAWLNDDGTVQELIEAPVLRQVFSEENCLAVRRMMIDVARYGTGHRGYVPGIEAANKTGTSSRKLSEDSVKDDIYSISSVVLLPAEDPQYVIITCALDTPHMMSKTAQVAARNISQYLIERDELALEYKAYDYNLLFTPHYAENVSGLAWPQALAKIIDAGFTPITAPGTEQDDLILSQYPPAGTHSTYGDYVWVSKEANAVPSERVAIPDFTGMSLQEAQAEAKRLKLNICFAGPNRAGKVSSQTVYFPELAGGSQPGDEVPIYTQIYLYFEGDDAPGPRIDDSLTPGYRDGSWDIFIG